MAANKNRWIKISALVLIVCLIAGLALSFFRFKNAHYRTFAYSNIQFSFDGAASGIAPNGEMLDINDLLSDAVIGEALAAAGMEGRYTVEQIRSQMEISGSYPPDINEQLMNYESLLDFNANRGLSLTSFHPTLFTVKLYHDFDESISRADLEKLLQCVMTSYEAHFNKVYSMNLGSTEISYDLSEYDYPQQLTILSRFMEQSLGYAEQLYDKAPTFLYNGISFNHIYVRLNNLINNDIAGLNAGITMSAAAKNTSRLLTLYQYEIRSLSNKLEKQNECLKNLDELIASYDKNEIIYLSTADSLTKIDGNSSETYDELVSKRKDVADGITQIIVKRDQYYLLLNDLLKSSGSAEQDLTAVPLTEISQEELEAIVLPTTKDTEQKRTALDASIELLVEKYRAVMDDFSKLVAAFNTQLINESSLQIVGKGYSAPKLISGAFASTVIKTAGPFFCVGLMICLVIIIADRRKKEKAA